jgi:hypothetical protein
VQIDHFNSAWRIHVSHGRRSYNRTTAKGILDAVRLFMCKLAEQGVREREVSTRLK